ncbi:MAG: phage holin, LLH family [Christensenellales bacterium]
MLVVMMVLAALVFALPVLAEGQEGQGTVLLDLTKLAQAIISLAAGIVSLYLVPWLRSKLTNEQLSKAKSWVQIAVFAAEKLYGAGNGDKKLAYAEEILREHGIRLDTATLKAMIDAQIRDGEHGTVLSRRWKGGDDRQSRSLKRRKNRMNESRSLHKTGGFS